MAEWLFEAGIGENRAALVADGAILEARIERAGEGPRCGAVLRARYGEPLVGRSAAKLLLDGGGEAFLDPVLPGIGPGARLTVEIVREALPGRRPKLAKARRVADETSLTLGPTLRETLTAGGVPVRDLRAIDSDLLEQAGWSELIEEAATGAVAFPGGALVIEPTQAMTTIDVDGDLHPAALAVAGAHAAGRAIRRLGIAGSIGIDLPTVADRVTRLRAAEALDAALPPPFERSAVNGWGFVQVIRLRRRASLSELIGGDPASAAALALYRRAERDPAIGPATISAHPGVIAATVRTPAHDAELARRRGAPVAWQADSRLAAEGGHVQVHGPGVA